MGSTEDMRRVMLLAADQLKAVPDHRVKSGSAVYDYGAPRPVLVAAAFAEATLRMLAAYVRIDDPQPTPELRKVVDEVLSHRKPQKQRRRGPDGRYLPDDTPESGGPTDG